MERETQQDQPQQGRKGQTLIEFAITLPLLLVLMFGIIEFGRIFQAWISIQNAARVSARYASTGQYLDEFEALILEESLENGTNDRESIVPCDEDTRVLSTGTTFRPSQANEFHTVLIFNEVDAFYSESLFGTWWGKDCVPRFFEPDPTDPDNIVTRVNATDQFLRLDLLRIPSIYSSAVQGAGGLAINPVQIQQIYQVDAWNDDTDGNNPDVNRDGVVDVNDDLDGNGVNGDAGDIDIAQNDAETPLGHVEARRRLTSFLYSVWHPTYPMHPNLDLTAAGDPLSAGVQSYRLDDEPSFSAGELDSYFTVTICSNRSVIGENATTFIGDGSDPREAQYANRFAISVYEPSVLMNDENEPEELQDWTREIVSEDGDFYNQFTDMPACFLNERFTGAENPGTRWLDPGGPGDTVDIAVSFYHPLITPLGLARFIPMHARRSAVVESFYNTTSQTGNIPGGPGGPGGFDTLTPVPTGSPTFTPLPTDTPEPTDTPVPTNTPTFTPEPQQQTNACPDISFNLFNTNYTGTDQAIGFNPGSVVFIIQNNNPTTDARLIAVDLHWSSAAWEANTSLAPVPGYDSFFMDEFELGIDTLWNGADAVPDTNTQSADDPGALPVELTIPANSQIKFEAKFKSGPSNLGNVLPLAAFDGTTFRIRDSLTLEECDELVFTSDTTDNVDADLELACDTGEVVFAASNNALQENGWVQLFVTNTKDAPVTLDGFDISWGPWEDRYRNDSTRSLALQRVYVEGDTPPQGELLWSSANGNNGTGITSLTNNAGTLEDPNVYTTVSEDDGLWSGPYTIPANATLNFWLDFTGNDLTDDSFGFLVSDLNASAIDVNCDDIDEDDVGLEDVPSPEPTVPTATPLPDDNEPPVSNDDFYTLTSPNTVLNSVDTSQSSVLDNDTDCADTSFIATNGGALTPCSMADATSGDPANFTNSGDNPLTVASCPRNNIETVRGATASLNCDGTFTYNATEADEVCEAASITDTFTYRAEDSRGLESSVPAVVSINITNPSTNQRPVKIDANENDILVSLDTAEGETSYTASSNPNSNENLNYLFNDEDGDTLTFEKVSGDDWITVNSDGSWSITQVPNWIINRPASDPPVRRQVTVRANDGSGICATQTSTFRVEIYGSGEEPPPPEPTDTDVPPPPQPTATEEDIDVIGGG